MQKFYSGLEIIESGLNEGFFCKGRGWHIEFETNPSSHVIVDDKPAKEIVIFTQSIDRAQHISNMILAAHYLYTGASLTLDPTPVFQNRAKTIKEIEEHLMAGGGRGIGVPNLSIACLIAAKASQKYAFQYAMFKYWLSCRLVPLHWLELDPQGDWTPGKATSILLDDHISYATSIILGYSVLEELSLDIRASNKEPSKIKEQWNPKVKANLQERLVKARIDLSELLLWNLRDTPTNIERARKLKGLGKCEWSGFKVRDKYVEIIEAIAYASWLRSKVSSHRLSRLAKSLTIHDVANVQHLARRLLLEVLGFWRYYETNSAQID